MVAEAVGARHRRRPAARPVLRPARARPHVSTRPSRDRAARSSTTIASSAPRPKLPAIDLSDGTAVVPFTSVVTAAGAAGSIATTATDLAHWAQALYAGAAARSADARRDGRRRPRTAKLKAAIAYGLGVQEVLVDGDPDARPLRPLPGARAAFRWLPDQRIAIAVLTNQSRTDVIPIAASLLKLALDRRSATARPAPACPDRLRARLTRARPEGLRRPVPTGLPSDAPRGGYSASRRGDEHGDPCRCLHERGDGKRHPRAPRSAPGCPRRGRCAAARRRRLAGHRRLRAGPRRLPVDPERRRPDRGRRRRPRRPRPRRLAPHPPRNGPVCPRGRAADVARLRPRPGPDPAVGRVPDAARHPAVGPGATRGGRRARRPRPGQPLRRRPDPGGPAARLLLPGRRRSTRSGPPAVSPDRADA